MPSLSQLTMSIMAVLLLLLVLVLLLPLLLLLLPTCDSRNLETTSRDTLGSKWPPSTI